MQEALITALVLIANAHKHMQAQTLTEKLESWAVRQGIVSHLDMQQPPGYKNKEHEWEDKLKTVVWAENRSNRSAQ